MLKKTISISIGLAAIMMAVVILSLPSDVADKNPGLMAPPTSVFEITQLDEINANTPNEPISDDTIPDETTRSVDDQPNREFAKYQNIAAVVGVPEMNVKILSNEDNSRTTILLSPNDITSETTDYKFKYQDQGIWISLYSLENDPLPLDIFTANPNDGFRVVKVNEQYNAAIQSMGKVEQYGEIVDRLLALDMVTSEYQISIRGLISDEQAIRIANYLLSK